MAPGWWSSRVGQAIAVDNVVLSRWPVAGVEIHELPHAGAGGERRSVLHARVESSVPIRVMSTQLTSSPLASGLRVAQVRALAAGLASRRRADEVVLLAGDMNAEPDSDEMRLLCGHKTAPPVCWQRSTFADRRRTAGHGGYRRVMSGISVGDQVTWDWGGHSATGKVTERFTKRVSRTIEGSRITRNATPEKPAFLVVQDDGGRVLKSITELERE